MSLQKSFVGNYFERLGITLKKMLYPQERDEQARKRRPEELAKLDSEKLVFLGETSGFVNDRRSCA